ncbi:MAG: ABC transporter permease, partial [Alphaproteobacteria bacterium]|nr:ABC transporter permease [Alphaproteobacteria bacterium]
MMEVLERVWRSPTGRIGLVLVAIVVLMALFADVIATHNPARIAVTKRFQAPSWEHLLGTDQLGRDLWSRLVHGTRIAMVVSFSVIALSLTAGTLLGIAAAYSPPRIERLFLMLFDIISSFPSLILALAMVAVLGPSLGNVIIIVSVTLVPHFGRVARAQVLQIKNAPFLEASTVIGVSRLRMVFVHVIPNILG